MRVKLTTVNPTLSEVALALRVNGGVFERMSREDVCAAAKAADIRLQDGRLPSREAVAAVAFAHQRRMEPNGVEVGQVWASTDRRDIRDGVRQHRTVDHFVTRSVPGRATKRYAMLRTEGSRLDGCMGVRIKTRADGSEYIDRHRLVHP